MSLKPNTGSIYFLARAGLVVLACAPNLGLAQPPVQGGYPGGFVGVSEGGYFSGTEGGFKSSSRREPESRPEPQSEPQKKPECNVKIFDSEHPRGICGENFLREIETKDQANLMNQNYLRTVQERVSKYAPVASTPAPVSLGLHQLMPGARLSSSELLQIPADVTEVEVKLATGSGAVGRACRLRFTPSSQVQFLNIGARQSSLLQPPGLRLGFVRSLRENGTLVRIPVENSRFREIECESFDGAPVSVQDLQFAVGGFNLTVSGTSVSGVPAQVFLPPEQVSDGDQSPAIFNGFGMGYPGPYPGAMGLPGIASPATGFGSGAAPNSDGAF